MIDKLKKYPVLTLGTDIRLNNGIGYSMMNNNTAKEVKEPGWEVLKYCEGNYNVDEITTRLRENWEISSDEVIAFLTKLEKNGFVEFKENQLYRQILVKGDINKIYPSFCSLEITSQCNLKCIYCYGGFNPQNSAHLAFNRIEPLFQLLSSIGVSAIDLTGGEPLTHPNFKEILKLAVKYFHMVGVVSNGVLFNDSIFELFEEEEYRKKVILQISIDGYTEEINTIVRGVKNTFHKSLNTIKKLAELRLKYRVVMVLTYENIHELEKTVDLFRSLGVNNFGISIADPVGRGVSLTHQDGTSLINVNSRYSTEFMNIIAEVCSKNKDMMLSREKLSSNNPDFEINVTNCGAGWRSITIDPLGNIYHCTMMSDNAPKIGNVFTDDLSKIFVNDNPVISFFKKFKKDADESVCVDCYYKPICNSCIFKIYLSNIQRIRKGEGLCPFVTASEMNKIFNFERKLKVNI